MKKYNIIKVVLITIFVLVLLSWIFPAAYYSGEFVDQGRVQMGLSELFNYPMTAISYFGHYAVLILLVGGFYGILYKIPAYRTFLDKIVKKFEGKEKVLLSILSIIIALLISLGGYQVAIALFIPLVVSLILLMGYDKIVSAMVVIGSIAVGLIGSTYSYATLNYLLSNLTLDLSYQIGVRFVMLLVGEVLLLFNIFMYIKTSMSKAKVTVKEEKKVEAKAEKVEEKVTTKKSTTKKNTSKKTTKKSTGKSTSKAKSKNANKAALKDEDIIVIKESVVTESDKNNYLVPNRVEATHKTWPFALFLGLLFVVFVLAFITWGDNGFKISFFDDLTKGFNEFKLFGFPIFAKIYGSITSFGNWTVIDLFLPMTLVILFLAIIYKVKLDDIFDGFVQGVKKALYPTFLMVLVYGILVLVTYHPFQLTIYKAIIGLTSGFNIVTTTVVAFLSSILNVDSTYVFQSFLPYYTSVVTTTDSYPLVGIITQSMYGFAQLFAPTSFVLMCVLAYLHISYKDWLKNIWKLIVELFVILLIIFIVLALL